MRAAFFDFEEVGRSFGKAVFVLINKNLLEIVQADKEARARVAGAAEATGTIGARVEAAREGFESQYAKQANDRIAGAQKEYEKALAEAGLQYKERLAQAEKELTQLYEQKKKHWVAELFNTVTGTEHEAS